ncbi:tetratricopeptide repeat protein [Alteromonas lipotrueae]|uniref:tetratricopeptide repeat protein n=1 Tax=Alteromonas lipotrueae TaxID=2803814 RepID=UPI001C4388C9|nr:tetratricopeptide repeat protein [Alteromonas lipotrueae]
MSVVNKMLKDLEAREGVEQSQARYEAPQKKSVSSLTIVVVVLVCVTVALVAWVLLKPVSSVSSAVSMPTTYTDKAPSTQQRSANLPIESSQSSTETTVPISGKARGAQKDDTNNSLQTSPQIAQQSSAQIAKVTLREHQSASFPQKSTGSFVATNPDTKPDTTPTTTSAVKPTTKQENNSKTVEGATESRFSKQVDNKNNAPAIEEQVRLALANNDYNEAIGLMQQKVQSDPSDTGAKKKLASLLFASGQVEQAQTLLQRMLVSSPDDHSVRLMLSRLYVKQGLTKIAIQNASDAVASPSNPLSIELLSFRANLQQQHGAFDKSLNDYLALTKRRPLEPKWWLGAGISADSLHQSALALSAYSQVVQIDTQQALSPDVHHYVQERIARLRDVVK